MGMLRVTDAPELFEEIEQLARREQRSAANMRLILFQEALLARRNSPVYGVDPSFSVIQKAERPVLTKMRKEMSATMEKGLDKQEALLKKDIVSDVDMSLEDNKFKVTVTPNKEKTKAYTDKKLKAGLNKNLEKLVEPVDSCPHGFAKGFCKKAECNRKYAK